MRTSVLLTLLIFTAVLSLTTESVYGNQSGYLPSVDIQAQFIEVKDLTAEFHTESGSITVSAQIRNVSHSLIKGYATIHFLSAEGEEIFSYEDVVNDRNPFAHGATVAFESTAQVGDIRKIATISVDFTQL